tara:strand:- start:1359 stop:1745 length:387 start_codon:yes stop_codon:yes gene_type:complete
MPDGMNEFFWFVLGVFSYRIVSGIFHYGTLAALFEEQLYHILKLLHILSKDLDTALEIKYNIMEDAQIHDEEIKLVKEADNKLLKVWREMTIARIITHWPQLYKKLISFNNWREAISYLKKNKKVVAK